MSTRRKTRPGQCHGLGCRRTSDTGHGGAEWPLLHVVTTLYVSPFTLAELHTFDADRLGAFVHNSLAGLSGRTRHELAEGFRIGLTQRSELMDMPRARQCYPLARRLRDQGVV
ncbi:hypothetical protein [Actinopolyspora halophila]|uniref:hypothetical protein n=1 Tax=Actinopolyspora halophila TaxID=1850 RepID=UPI0003737876|nr:hypothetical protein [Actinopolyspora halophila]